jgi:hypothetical protein
MTSLAASGAIDAIISQLGPEDALVVRDSVADVSAPKK